MPTIRPATHNDIPAITEIYNEAGVGTTASYALEPVTVADRRATQLHIYHPGNRNADSAGSANNT